MASIIKSFESYIYKNIGVSVSPCTRAKVTSLPYFILDEYVLYRTKILHKEYILLVPKSQQEVSPATVRKHVDIVKDKLCQEVVFVHPSISSHNRKRLIEYKVPFVVPDNQMYLPDLMIDLRDHFFSARSGKTTFSPSTQVVILYILHHFRAQPFIPSELAKRLGYSNMAMTRAFDEIETATIGRIDTEGRQRWLWVQDNPQQFWQKTLAFLRTPVRRQVWLRSLPEELRQFEAGQTALSRYSMLAPSNYKTFAAEKKDWDFYARKYAVETFKSKEDADFQLQLWNYSPTLFAEDNAVDKFSLYLSLKDNEDERIQAALEKMMESIEW